jgi:hypothetical protein
MNLAPAYSKALLTNQTLWFWGGVFMLFWIVIGAFVESQGLALSGTALRQYAAAWYAVVVLLSLSMLAVAIANSLTYGSSALAYAFRYTRLTPTGYFVSVLAASAALGFFLGFLILAGTVGVFGARFHASVLPANVPGLTGVALLAGAFYMALASVLMLLVINYVGLRSTSLVGFVPLMLSYAFGLAQVFLVLPAWLLYGSPYNDITSLLYQGFSGSAVPVGAAGGAPTALAWPILAGALVAWSVGLSGAATVLLRRIRARQLEEGRQV